MAQLETLEAKMASIEVSLSTTPRRKKSSSAASTPIPQPPHSIANGITTSVYIQSTNNNSSNNSNHSSTTNLVVNGSTNNVNGLSSQTPTKDIASEMETIRNNYKDKENIINTMKSNGGWNSLGRLQNGLNEKEKKIVQERLKRLKVEVDAKRLAIKSIKMALDNIDVSDNIDVRIQQAELEYKLGREELNLLSILEETRNLQSHLEDIVVPQQSIFCYIGDSAVSVHGVELNYDPKSPQFGAGTREENALYIEWAADGSGLCKGDRVLEVNGKIVVGKTKEDMNRLLCVSPCPAQIVVLRKESQIPEQIMCHLQAELNVVKEKAGEAERTRDSFRSDNLRLTHRISYLEEQVAELLERARESQPRAKPQVFQKGSQVALVAGLPGLDKSEKKLPSSRSKIQDEVRSAKSVDVLLEKPRRKKELSLGRSTNSLDVDSGLPMRQRHRHHHDRSTDHLHGELRQRHLREARSSLFTFLDKNSPSKYSDLDSEATYARDTDSHTECNSESSLRYYKKNDKVRPVPPKKPIRLSLQRATSLQSVDQEKKTLKRTHKGDAPQFPFTIGHTNGKMNGHSKNHHSSSHHLEGNWC
ncbi:hypothetical protein GE061_018294 [Apolygus lucorum]|uniref:PDZ domain-containing protein n=1 Tax=Apolygus lucorum TaxID=248454 RepID=A0A8S9XG66_APOLU|nr:hypothetical protein GE061_018294 [Apolygus lucorum]